MAQPRTKKKSAANQGELDAEKMILAGFPVNHASGYYRSAGIRMPGYGILGGLQKFRGNFDLLSLRKKFQLSRWLFENNWFVGPVVSLKTGVVVDGFRFAGRSAREWVKVDESTRVQSPQASYDWSAVARDVVNELLLCDNVVALWRKGEEFPFVEVLDCESVEHASCGGKESITLSFKAFKGSEERLGKIISLYASQWGSDFCDLIRNGGTREIVQGDDPEFEFLSLTRGKRGDAFKPPSLLSIADDLDFIEMIKVGDWNGAFARQKIVRTMKKGTEVRTSDPSAIKAGKATAGEITAMKKRLDMLDGVSNLASSHDVALAWETFAPEFFGSEGSLTASPRQRIMGWGGWAALLIMQGFTQFRGGSGDISGILRIEVSGIRAEVVPFISKIFNHPDFGLPSSAPYLAVEFSDSLLYTTEELMAMARTLSGTGLASFETVREKYLGLDSASEGALLKDSHDDRLSFTPPFEGRQGLLQLDGADPYPSRGGEGGRPKSGEGDPDLSEPS
jgi:hypothetical protein